MIDFKINELSYFFESRIYEDVTIIFSDKTLIFGDNTSGKTGIFNTLDTLLGKENCDKIAYSNEFNFNKVKMKFTIDNNMHVIEYFFDYNKKGRTVKSINLNGQSIVKNGFKDDLTKLIYGATFEGEKNYGIRNFLIFNFFHEHNVGSPTVLLSKLREQKYYSDITDTFTMALSNKKNNISFLKSELRSKNEELSNLKSLQMNQKKFIKEKNELKKLITGKDSNFTLDDKLDIDDIFKIQDLKRVKNQINDRNYLDQELEYLNVVKNNIKNKEELEELEEVLNSVKNTILMKQYVVDNVDKTINEIENEIRKKNVDFRSFLLSVNDDEKNYTQEINDCNNEIEKIQNEIKKSMNNLKKALDTIADDMKTMLSSICHKDINNELKEDYHIEIKGSSFDPVIYIDKNGKKYVKNISSHSLQTIFQLVYILSLHKYSLENDGSILNFIVLDTFSQPFALANSVQFIDILTQLTKDLSVQIILFDKDETVKNTCLEMNYTIYEINEDKLFIKKQ